MSKFIEASDVAFTSGASVGAFKGAVKNLSNRDYHALKSYWSSSDLKYLYANSPAHFKALYFDKTIERKEPTQAMILGSLVHTLVLTPDDFSKEFFIMPELNLRTNDGKAMKEELLMANPGKYAVTDEMVAQAHRMRESVYANPRARELLEPLKKEYAFFWNCPFSHQNFRAKLDGCASSHFIELKTTTDASPERFARHAYDMNYDLSLIHYRQALAHTMGCEPPPYFIVVEDSSPFLCQVYKVGDSFLQTGHEKWLSAVSKLEEGIKKGNWPGYSDEKELEINPPPWAVNKLIKGEMNGI